MNSVRQKFQSGPGRGPALADSPTRVNGIIVHALHKSASMFLFKLFQNLAGLAKMQFFSNNQPGPIDFETEQPFVLCPVRSFVLDQFVFSNADRIRRVIQIRDPRDILVSQYFSLGWIHPDSRWSDEEKQRRMKIQSLSIDEYVLRESEFSKTSLLERYREVLPLLDRPDCTIVRYEEMVSDFNGWLRPILKQFDFRFPWLIRRRLLREFRGEFEVEAESMQHRRRITPGDHLEKLKPDTIRRLNRDYADLLRPLNYLH